MKRPPVIVLASTAAAGASLAATAWHIAKNAAPPVWDDAWYLEVSFRLWGALTAGPASFIREYLSAFRIKAPLISLVPLPLYAFCGPGERVAVWANLPLAAVAAWAWSKAATAWWKEHPRARELGALAGALAALLPLAYGLSRQFLAETLVSALLALWAWRCAAAASDDRAEGWRLGILLGLGLLAKSTFPLLAAGLAWPARERLRPHAKTALVIGGLLAATWYLENAPYILGFSWSAGFGSVARDYAGAGGLAARLGWAQALVRDGLSWPVAAAAAGIGVAAWVGRRPRADDGLRAALWGLAPLVIYAAGVNREPRLVAPLLPVAAALMARSALSFKTKAVRDLASATLLAAGIWTLAQQTFVARGAAALRYNGAPQADAGWDREALVAASLGAAGPDAVVALALEHAKLNANNLSSKAAERGLGLRFISLGYAQTSAEAALIRLKDKSATALVLVDGIPGEELPGFLNRTNAEIARAVSSGRLRARAAGTVLVAPGVTATIYSLK